MICPKCGLDAGTSNFCPKCGANLAQWEAGTPAPKKKKHTALKIVVAIFAVIIVIGIIGSIGGESNDDTPTPTTPTSNEPATVSPSEKPENLEVLDHTIVTEGTLRHITGHIKNNTQKTYSYLQVSINLYKDDALVGSTLDNVNNLGPGETWEFDALIWDDSADSYKIIEVTGW